jgi:hypothetical protein
MTTLNADGIARNMNEILNEFKDKYFSLNFGSQTYGPPNKNIDFA